MDIQDSISYQITKTGNLLRQLTAKMIKDAGLDITPEEAVLLNQLWDKDYQSLSELGRWSVKGPSTVTRQIDGLVKKSYVERVHCPEDRRKIYAKLTRKGKSLQVKFDHSGIRELDKTFRNFTSADSEKLLHYILDLKQQTLEKLEQ